MEQPSDVAAVDPEFSVLADWIYAACVWEAWAPKAGNVHPGAAFADLQYADFVRSARITADYYRRHSADSLKATSPCHVLAGIVRELSERIGKNTNLGILLLLTPMAAVVREHALREGIGAVIDSLDQAAARELYAAIRQMQPGGMRQVAEQDLADEPTLPVRDIMRLAAGHDLIAKQYADNFVDVLTFGLDRIDFWWHRTAGDPARTVVGLHLDWMAHYPDTLICRKLGPEVAEQSSLRARQVLTAGWPETGVGQQEWTRFDQWLRADGHRRNPGTSADLVAATLFAAFREGILPWPNPQLKFLADIIEGEPA